MPMTTMIRRIVISTSVLYYEYVFSENNDDGVHSIFFCFLLLPLLIAAAALVFLFLTTTLFCNIPFIIICLLTVMAGAGVDATFVVAVCFCCTSAAVGKAHGGSSY